MVIPAEEARSEVNNDVTRQLTWMGPSVMCALATLLLYALGSLAIAYKLYVMEADEQLAMYGMMRLVAWALTAAIPLVPSLIRLCIKCLFGSSVVRHNG